MTLPSPPKDTLWRDRDLAQLRSQEAIAPLAHALDLLVASLREYALTEEEPTLFERSRPITVHQYIDGLQITVVMNIRKERYVRPIRPSKKKEA